MREKLDLFYVVMSNFLRSEIWEHIGEVMMYWENIIFIFQEHYEWTLYVEVHDV